MAVFDVRVEGTGSLRLASGRTITLGRAPDADLVIAHPRVSWHHASLWVGGGQLWLSDLGSSNGTTVDGRPVRQAVALRTPQKVLLGGQVAVELREVDASPPRFVVRRSDLTGGLALRKTLRFGEGDVDVPFPVAFELHASAAGVLIRDDSGEHDVPVNAEFTRAGVVFTIEAAEGSRRRTALGTDQGLAYALHAGLTPAFAELVEPSGEVLLRIEAETRVTLAYVLGSAVGEDQAGSPRGQGWVEDYAVARALWGRQLGDDVGNRLKVLVHRVRKEFKSAGVPGNLIERRGGWMRLRVMRALLDPT
ncbi:MAG: FHA domain-containing protein [Proteobacteria bacterium]|nr:FHA domain-containing protein [Pseudomonadota bacterium]